MVGEGGYPIFHNYLGAESRGESEQVLEELTSKATSPEEPGPRAIVVGGTYF